MAYRSRAAIDRENRNVVGATVLIMVVLLGAFSVAPGMMFVTFAIRPFAMGLDRGQLWTFSVVACAAIYVAIRLASSDGRFAGRWYLGLCALSIFSFAVAKFAFHASWPDLMVDAFTRGAR